MLFSNLKQKKEHSIISDRVISSYMDPIYIGLVSLFNGISTLFRLFNAKAILLEEQ